MGGALDRRQFAINTSLLPGCFCRSGVPSEDFHQPIGIERLLKIFMAPQASPFSARFSPPRCGEHDHRNSSLRGLGRS